MLYTVLSCAVFLLALGGAGRSVVREWGFLRARRKGIEVQADIVENATHGTGQRNTYWLAPVVGYHLDGRRHIAEVSNASGQPGTVGSAMTVVVDPDKPGVVYDRYGGFGAVGRNWLALFALSVVNVVIMLSVRLH
jgi:hypothetical protein